MDKDYFVTMKDPKNVVEVDCLQTCFSTENGTVRSVDGVSFHIPAGKTLCVVGESGCGKSVTGLSLMRLLPEGKGRIVSGQIRLNTGTQAIDIVKAPEKLMQTLRGGVISMIFQEPMTALNPVLPIGYQLGEAISLHTDGKGVKTKVQTLLETVGIPNPTGVAKMYPHNLSGGMRQRVCIAMALAGNPRLIIADEPTTALDVTVQAQILELLQQLKHKTGCSVMLVTHDLGVVAQMADLVAVMYAGRVVESGTVKDIFYRAAHPYTRGLLASRPVIGQGAKRLYAIGGAVPNPISLPDRCYFFDRCESCGEDCHGLYPKEIALSDTHKVSCYFPQAPKEGLYG